MPAGKAYLIGAGPGRIDYLTLRGYHLLQQADVVLYDALVDPAMLDVVPKTCTSISVGKRGGQPSLTQSEIDDLLVQHCQQGHQVVRLKSGDPFVFGRSTSEIQALTRAGIAVEVVPGLSSALAGPLLAGIPLTDPVMSRCFAVLSAHEPEALDWSSLVGIETLVMLMGARHVANIVERLIAAGRSPHTPIAIIRWAGHPDQQVWAGTLQTIVQQVARQSLSPAVLVIGEVVGLRPYLQGNPPTPYNHPETSPPLTVSETSTLPLPLTGHTVLITRSAGQSSQFAKLLQAQGATVLEMPAIEVGPPSSWNALDGAIAQLSQFQWLILTSTNGVDYFFQRLTAQGKDARALAEVKIAVVGKKTAQQLKGYGLQADFIPPDFVADALVEHFPEPLKELQILFPRVETGGRDVLVQEFTQAGARVTEVAAYQSGCTQTLTVDIQQALEAQHIQAITFASSKTVQCFHQLLKQHGLDVDPLLASVCIASIGPQTSDACRRWLGRVDIEATEYTLEGLTTTLAQWASSSDPITE
ncbi:MULTISPECIES: uroporphyrinogen-III C-methyltransferase [unclassified Leptolyngbya]|uniref:uroporphyrinogen-III C-methyltransferase n=1 Tax=unclassified Leptolyngbya TaxID=2650499 RepID=UPI001685E8E3|nr:MULTISPECIES: uroporphyrinogen-III C-methyltransferase [unclassified Leptolyngbya]MBD1912777.1 uroporphyrinogen-III C-methyltransferase [Leptolyngbya sp. FACHB-8]MBD2157724.1 uroporphyrinogen-III C-methyltransferase [Leptolyngbya sp. FACHB-16]